MYMPDIEMFGEAFVHLLRPCTEIVTLRRIAMSTPCNIYMLDPPASLIFVPSCVWLCNDVEIPQSGMHLEWWH